MPRDVFRIINDLDDAAVERITARLEFRATDPGYIALREAYVAKLPLASAGGCSPSAAAPASRSAPSGGAPSSAARCSASTTARAWSRKPGA